MSKKYHGLRHGEIVLVPRKLEAGQTKKINSYVVGHSESGHHHVIEGEMEITETGTGNIFVTLLKTSEIVHKKMTDQHNTLTIPRHEVLKRYHDTEYDPWSGVIRDVAD